MMMVMMMMMSFWWGTAHSLQSQSQCIVGRLAPYSLHTQCIVGRLAMGWPKPDYMEKKLSARVLSIGAWFC